MFKNIKVKNSVTNKIICSTINGHIGNKKNIIYNIYIWVYTFYVYNNKKRKYQKLE